MCTVYGAMSFEVTQAHPPMLAQRALLCFGQAKVGLWVISMVAVVQFHSGKPHFLLHRKSSDDLTVSLQAITACFSTVFSRLWREGETFPPQNNSRGGEIFFTPYEEMVFALA